MVYKQKICNPLLNRLRSYYLMHFALIIQIMICYEYVSSHDDYLLSVCVFVGQWNLRRMKHERRA